MKLLLTSGGLANNSIIDSLKNLTQKPFSELNLGLIPTAANLEAGDKWWLIEDLETCKKLGFKSIDLIDISALPEKIYRQRLEKTNVLLFEGGNTYHLMYWVKQSGLIILLPELLKERVYIGISAGSIIATPSMVFCKEEKEAILDIGEDIGDEGLGLVNFLVEPHINNKHFPELTFDYVKMNSAKIDCPIYALDDNSAVEVINGQIRVVSEGNWKKFSPAK
ncbi:MAG: Type 1 glutamine amidotransferase-like domain-containing protein [Candidatus Shapirobacteria bacterium]